MRLLAQILVVLLLVAVSWAFVIQQPPAAAPRRLPSVSHSARKRVPDMTMADETGSSEGDVESDSSSSSDAASSSAAEADATPTTLASSTTTEEAEPSDDAAARPAKPLVPFESPEPESWRETEPPPYVVSGESLSVVCRPVALLALFSPFTTVPTLCFCRSPGYCV